MAFLNTYAGQIFRVVFVVTKDTAKYTSGAYTAAEGFLLFLIFLIMIFGVLYEARGYHNQWKGLGLDGQKLPQSYYFYKFTIKNKRTQEGWLFINY